MLTVPAVVLAVAMPSTAAASSLLSGYGGPGQGNQAILGSTLLNGPSNGGGGGGSAGGGGSGTPSLAKLAVPVAASAGEHGSAGSAGRRPASSAAHARRTANRSGALAPASGSGAYHSIPALARSASGGSGALGVSGADLLYIILALGALTLTGLLTRQLVRGDGASGPPAAKGMRRRTRGIE